MTTWRSSYAAGHDLAEPLRSISGFADLLRPRYRGRLDHDADQSIDFVTSGAARMQQLINDLLAYGRLTTRTQPMATVDVQQVLDSVLADLNGRIHMNELQRVVQQIRNAILEPTAELMTGSP